MKLLLINGSPKGKRSNSLKLALQFIQGVRAAQEEAGATVEVKELDVATLKVGACRGCFACWQSTPGECCIKDDMQMVIQEQIAADVIVWSFPLYYFNVPGILKNLIDRQLPMNLPFMSSKENGYSSGSHDSRYDMSGKRHVLISTCGFYSAKGNYDSVLKMFDHFLGRGNYSTIFCGQGELFRIKELSARTDAYLEIVQEAGKEFAVDRISEKTAAKLEELLYPREVFEEMADASWGVSRDSGEKEAKDLSFTRQMAALYRKEAWDGKDRVLEMHYTDLEHTYQILLGKDGSKVYTDGSLKTTTRIDTSFEVWSAVARGEIGGAEALGKRMYKVSGDFSLMIKWDDFFGSAQAGAAGRTTEQENTEGPDRAAGQGASRDGTHKKKGLIMTECLPPSMTTMLIPWITFWIAVSINEGIGAVITLGVLALIPFMMRKRQFVIWDQLSMIAVAVLSVFANVTGNGNLATNLGYLVFGLMWLLSCPAKEPLCATYVKYNYGGEKAYKNPLFMKTNYILAACWGVLYLLTAVWTYFLRQAGLGAALIVVNNLVPVVMGVFTVWFEKWYPAWLAGGGGR
ncbi:MAG: NAD(P)H-dependent oxidoreductase [Lachnospiraceae bacterium]|nr:NAD(P)H-dependent oxidoreductase [Lachnospiraceae bacterium]